MAVLFHIYPFFFFFLKEQLWNRHVIAASAKYEVFGSDRGAPDLELGLKKQLETSFTPAVLTSTSVFKAHRVWMRRQQAWGTGSSIATAGALPHRSSQICLLTPSWKCLFSLLRHVFCLPWCDIIMCYHGYSFDSDSVTLITARWRLVHFSRRCWCTSFCTEWKENMGTFVYWENN